MRENGLERIHAGALLEDVRSLPVGDVVIERIRRSTTR